MGTIDSVAARFEAAKKHLRQPINHVLPPSVLLYLVPPLPSLRTLVVLLALSLLVLLRIWSILPSRNSHAAKPRSSAKKDGCTVGVFLGSGGHTTELLQLVSALPACRYPRRIYLVSSGDKFSLNKARQLESKLTGDAEGVRAIQIPRARNVHQSFLTAPLTTAYSIAFCIYTVALLPLLQPSRTRVLADVILMNGPGTCVPIVAAVYLLRVSTSHRTVSKSIPLTSFGTRSWDCLRPSSCTSSRSHASQVSRSPPSWSDPWWTASSSSGPVNHHERVVPIRCIQDG